MFNKTERTDILNACSSGLTAEAVERHLTEYGVRVPIGYRRDCIESLDLEIDLSTPLTITASATLYIGSGAASLGYRRLVRRCVVGRVCIRRALKRCARGLVHRRAPERLFAAPVGLLSAMRGRRSAVRTTGHPRRTHSVDRVTRLPPSARRLSACTLTHHLVIAPLRDRRERRRLGRYGPEDDGYGALPGFFEHLGSAAGWVRTDERCWTCGRLPIREGLGRASKLPWSPVIIRGPRGSQWRSARTGPPR